MLISNSSESILPACGNSKSVRDPESTHHYSNGGIKIMLGLRNMVVAVFLIRAEGKLVPSEFFKLSEVTALLP